jgi:hypothetical protein
MEMTLMKRLLWLGVAFGLSMAVGAASAQTSYYPYNGTCTQGATKTVTQGLNSTNTHLSAFPACTVTVFASGTTTLATLHSNATGSPLSNPFTAPLNGLFTIFVTANPYDVVVSGSGITTTTFSGVYPFAPAAATCTSSSCIVPNPAGNQTITQPVGTALSIDKLAVGYETYAPLLSGQYQAVFTGDSTCAGFLNPTPATDQWPYQLSQLPFLKNRYTVQPNCIAGQTAEQWRAAWSTQVQPYAPNGTTRLVTDEYALIGRNNLAESPATVEALISAQAAADAGVGITFHPNTILPSSLTPIGPTLKSIPVTSVSQTNPSGTGGVATIYGTGFTNVAGDLIYFPGSGPNSFSIPATLISPSANGAATCNQDTSTLAKIVIANTYTAGQLVYVSYGDGACGYLENNAFYVSATGLSTSQFELITPPITPNTAASGNIQTSRTTGVGYPLGSNILTVAASPAPTSTQMSFLTGPEQPYAQTTSAATVFQVAYPEWDSISRQNEDNRQAINTWIRQTFPNTYWDFASLVADPNAADSTGTPNVMIDGTHETAAIGKLLAKHGETNMIAGKETLSGNPTQNWAQPVTSFSSVHPDSWFTGVPTQGPDPAVTVKGPAGHDHIYNAQAVRDCQLNDANGNFTGTYLPCVLNGSEILLEIGTRESFHITLGATTQIGQDDVIRAGDSNAGLNLSSPSRYTCASYWTTLANDECARFQVVMTSGTNPVATANYTMTGAPGAGYLVNFFTSALGVTFPNIQTPQAIVLGTTYTYGLNGGLSGQFQVHMDGSMANSTLHSTTGTRFICVDTSGNFIASATACSGT